MNGLVLLYVVPEVFPQEKVTIVTIVSAHQEKVTIVPAHQHGTWEHICRPIIGRLRILPNNNTSTSKRSVLSIFYLQERCHGKE